jgi:alpha-tubulin suppressor-like RCC1 family protein
MRLALLLSALMVLSAIVLGAESTPPARGSASPTTLKSVTQMGASMASRNACALLAAGTVRCWGDNPAGMLGDNTGTALSRAPVEVCASGSWSVPDLACRNAGVPSTLSGIEQISVGGDHVCVLTTAGGVKCWGQNGLGALGDNFACGTVCPTPVDVTGLQSGVVAITSGWSHSCALVEVNPPDDDHRATCWGYNHYGQLGEGHLCSTHICPEPEQVTGLEEGVSQISAGALHTCAVLNSGSVKCWGLNVEGQLGEGTNDEYHPTPLDVCAPGESEPCAAFLSGAAAVTSGLWHTCAAMTSGTAYCWGLNAEGQLGDGSVTSSRVPVPVCAIDDSVPCADQLDTVASISAGWGHTCALQSGGTPSCWGSADFGQLGNGISGGTNDSVVPRNVCASGSGAACPSLGGVTQVSAGFEHACARMQDTSVRCWGANDRGELGDSSPFDRLTPVAATLDTDRDGCSDARESQTAAGSQIFGGLRSPTYHRDFFDVWTPDPQVTGGFVRDQIITTVGDILGVAGRFGPDEGTDGIDKFSNPLSTPAPAPTYHPAFDRGAIIGPNSWDRAPPDGVISIVNDILGAAGQFGHNCR